MVWEAPKLPEIACKKPAKGQQKASKRPRGQQEASKKPARRQQEARKRPEEARKKPQMGGTPRNTETIEKQPFS